MPWWLSGNSTCFVNKHSERISSVRVRPKAPLSRPHRITVSTPPFHGVDRSSILLGGTNFLQEKPPTLLVVLPTVAILYGSEEANFRLSMQKSAGI